MKKIPENFPVKPALIILVAVIFIVGAGFAILGNNNTQAPQVSQPTTSEQSNLMNDSEMMDNLENGTDEENELINDNEDTSDLYENSYGNTGTVQLTKTLTKLPKAVTSAKYINQPQPSSPSVPEQLKETEPSEPPTENLNNEPAEQPEETEPLESPAEDLDDESAEQPEDLVEEPQDPTNLYDDLEEGQQIEEEWDPLEDPIEMEDPDADESEGNTEDIGDEEFLNS